MKPKFGREPMMSQPSRNITLDPGLIALVDIGKGF